MKISNSKKQLAKIIHENGGWREGAEFTAQDGDGTGSIDFFKSKPRLYKGDIFWKGDYDCDDRIERTGVTIKNWHKTILSREEYYQVCPKADGWIEWNGGECPVYGELVVYVNYRDGGKTPKPVKAGSQRWNHSGLGGDIMSYSLHKPDVEPEFCESVTRSIPEPESKSTIEQLAANYRNKLDYANRKQDEADKANMESDAALAQLKDAIAEIGFAITPLAATEKEPELVITDWRDLRVGDVIELTGSKNPCWKEHFRSEMTVREVYQDRGDNDDQVDLIGESGCWSLGGNTTWRFIRRP